MTDLPDAKTAWAEWFPVAEKSPRPGEREAFLAGFAAASGPWAEQLDAAGWRTEAYDARKQIAGLAADLDAVLARNAELERRITDTTRPPRPPNFLEAERDALRAELDNLRETLAQKIEAEKYDSDVPTTVKEQGRNWGLDEAAAIVRGSDDE